MLFGNQKKRNAFEFMPVNFSENVGLKLPSAFVVCANERLNQICLFKT